MDLTITLTGRDANPRVINIKQYSSRTDNISFILGEDVPISQQSAICAVIGGGYIQQLSLDGNLALWCISPVFTQKTGSFGVQLKISYGDVEWYSDVMLLIVSESEDGNTPVPDEEVPVGVIPIYGIFNYDFCGIPIMI